MTPRIPDDSTGTHLKPVDFDPFAAPQSDRFSLSTAQREIWSAVQMGPEASCAYNLCFALRLTGAVSIEALQRSVLLLLARHEALRLKFDPYGEWRSVPAEQPSDLPLADLSGLAPAERNAVLEAMFVAEVETPLDLVNGPPVRLRLVVEARDRCLLVLAAHHIAFDGWSAWIFFRELATLYAGALGGVTPSLPPAEPFGRFVAGEADAEGRERADRHASSGRRDSRGEAWSRKPI